MKRLTATPWSALPEHLHHRGAPSDWAKMTRPGQPMHSFLEAAFFDSSGNLWLCDVPYGRVFRIAADGHWELMHQIDGEPHAMRIAPDGRHIAVDYKHGLIELTGQTTFEQISNGGPIPFLGLSDMTYSPDGALWFTDSGRSSLSDPCGRVYRWHGGDLRMVADCVPYSNGIAVSPDNAWVYVAATRANQVWKFSTRFPVENPAQDMPDQDTRAAKTGMPMIGTYLNLSGGLGPDGLACNAQGWLAVAQAQAGRAYVFDALGDMIADIRLPRGQWTTSVTFHPADPHQLFIVDAQYGGVFTCHVPPP